MVDVLVDVEVWWVEVYVGRVVGVVEFFVVVVIVIVVVVVVVEVGVEDVLGGLVVLFCGWAVVGCGVFVDRIVFGGFWCVGWVDVTIVEVCRCVCVVGVGVGDVVVVVCEDDGDG